MNCVFELSTQTSRTNWLSRFIYTVPLTLSYVAQVNQSSTICYEMHSTTKSVNKKHWDKFNLASLSLIKALFSFCARLKSSHNRLMFSICSSLSMIRPMRCGLPRRSSNTDRHAQSLQHTPHQQAHLRTDRQRTQLNNAHNYSASSTSWFQQRHIAALSVSDIPLTLRAQFHSYL